MAAVAMMHPPRTQMPSSATLTGSRSGLAYKLGQEIGAGGNGIVYTVSRRPELVAKIQKHALSQHDVDKLDVLVRAATPELLSVAAWPTDLLKAPNGHVVGFVMPRVLDARPLYELYSPRSRIQQFPSADFRFLVHAAANVARLFASVHKAGFICGDVNHSNILVRQTATVAAVDCDSFQVGDGSRFPCLVGTELFVPPELMGVALGATRRTANHDNFGLAVLIFHLLFMGRHPFAGRFLGHGEMPIERAIAESRFAYSRDSGRTQMAPPPYTPPMSILGPAVTELFELAFHPQSRGGGRPSPETWIDALEAFKVSLVQCKSVISHHHPAGISACPWCAIEGPTRIKLFGGIIKIAAAAIADLETLWARYLALVEPEPLRPLPVIPPRPRRPWTFKRPKFPVIRNPQQVLDAVKRRALSFAGRIRGNHIFWAVCAVYFTAKFYWDELGAMARAAPVGAQTALEKLLSVPWDPLLTSSVAFLVLLAGPMIASLLGRIGLAALRLFVSAPQRPTTALPFKFARSLSGAGRRDAKRAWAKAACHRYVVQHPAGWTLRCAAPEAVQLARAAFSFSLLTAPFVELAKVASSDEMGALGFECGKLRVDPIPHGLLMHAVEACNFLDRVAAVDLGAQRIEGALAGHGSRRAGFDELANIFRSPCRDPAAKFDRLRVAAGFDAGPPSRPADRNRPLGTEDLLQA